MKAIIIDINFATFLEALATTGEWIPVLWYALWLAMERMIAEDFAGLYACFHAPIAYVDCGQRCAPYNEGDAPFCCDTRHAVPAAYLVEWEYLEQHTDLWHVWEGKTPELTEQLRAQAPDGQVLIECKGYSLCQRDFRSLTCRAFPFFPYITRQGQFVGLSCYWEYEQCCWVINNLQVVSPLYVEQFVQAFDWLFTRMPDELTLFQHFSRRMRRVFGRRHRLIPLFHRDGRFYKISPRDGRLRRSAPEKYPKSGVYKIAASLPFPDELDQDGPETAGAR